MENELFELAQQLGQLLISKQKIISTAESCTGGWISQVLTEVPGSSAWFDRGFVTYSNEAKMEMLGVNESTLTDFGAVSAQTAIEMAEGVLKHSNADCAIAVTGIGTIFIALTLTDKTSQVVKKTLVGNRHEIRQQTVKIALTELITQLQTVIV